MFPDFFIRKDKEVLSFLHIMKGKATGDHEARKKGVDEALASMDEEREVYLQERREAERGVDSDIPFKKKGTSQPERDISAI